MFLQLNIIDVETKRRECRLTLLTGWEGIGLYQFICIDFYDDDTK